MDRMTSVRKPFLWNIGSRRIELGHRTLVMGILNVTPDSFSDGGRFIDPTRAVEHGIQLLEEGADILDVGGESTRPGAAVSTLNSVTGAIRPATVSTDEEIGRVVPVIEGIKKLGPDAIVSIDTYKSVTARAAVHAGADIVNDVSGFQWDPQMADICADLDCGVVLMHMRGLPETWRTLPALEDPVTLVKHELGMAVRQAQEAGVARDRIVLDPGFGFGKSFEENYPLLANLDELAELGFPILAGTSRKSFVERAALKDVPPSERLSGSLAAMVMSIMKGAHVVRVHDVKESVEAARLVDAVLNSNQ
jgi:dihydropteroate synthase